MVMFSTDGLKTLQFCEGLLTQPVIDSKIKTAVTISPDGQCQCRPPSRWEILLKKTLFNRQSALCSPLNGKVHYDRL